MSDAVSSLRPRIAFFVHMLEVLLGLAEPVLFRDNVCVQVVERAVALGASGESAVVLAENLVVAPAETAMLVGRWRWSWRRRNVVAAVCICHLAMLNGDHGIR